MYELVRQIKNTRKTYEETKNGGSSKEWNPKSFQEEEEDAEVDWITFGQILLQAEPAAAAAARAHNLNSAQRGRNEIKTILLWSLRLSHPHKGLRFYKTYTYTLLNAVRPKQLNDKINSLTKHGSWAAVVV